MEIYTESSGPTGIITFLGKTLGEPADSKLFETQFKTLLKEGVKQVILDLHQVHRINSTGLAILITATTLLSNSGGSKVALAGSNDFIKGALTLTRLNQFFDCYDDVSEATEKLNVSSH